MAFAVRSFNLNYFLNSLRERPKSKCEKQRVARQNGPPLVGASFLNVKKMVATVGYNVMVLLVIVGVLMVKEINW